MGMVEIKFVAKTRNNNGTVVLTVPHHIKLTLGSVYQFSVETDPINEEKESGKNELESDSR